MIEHKINLEKNLKIGIKSLSSTRTLDNDESGKWIAKEAKKEGHEIILHLVIKDNLDIIKAEIKSNIEKLSPHALILTGGTGLSPKDVTIEAVKPLFDKELTGFATVFSMLSFEEIDSATVLSRACAGIINKTVVFCLPGSLKACKLACKNLIFPEIGHILKHLFE